MTHPQEVVRHALRHVSLCTLWVRCLSTQELEQARAQLVAAEQLAGEAQLELQLRQAELGDVVEELSTVRTQLQHAEEQRRSLVISRRQFQLQLEAAQAEVAAMTESQSSLQQSLTTAVARCTEQAQVSAAAVAQLTEQVAGARSQAKRLAGELQSEQARVTDLLQQVAAEHDRSRDLSAQLEQFRAAAASAAAGAQHQADAAASATIVSLRAALEAAQARATGAEERVSAAEARCAQLTDELREHRGDAEQLRGALVAAVRTARSAEEDAATRGSRHEQVVERLEAAQRAWRDERAALRGQCDTLSARVELLTQQLQHEHNERNNLAAITQQLRNDLALAHTTLSQQATRTTSLQQYKDQPSTASQQLTSSAEWQALVELVRAGATNGNALTDADTSDQQRQQGNGYNQQSQQPAGVLALACEQLTTLRDQNRRMVKVSEAMHLSHWCSTMCSHATCTV